MERVQIARRVSLVTVLWNTILSVIKIVVGFFGHSSAIVADGIHSMSDVFTTVIAYIGVQLSAKRLTRIINMVMKNLNLL